MTNGIMFMDLYLVLKNPFYSRDRRMKKQYILLVLSSLGLSFIIINTLLEQGTNLKRYDFEKFEVYFSVVKITTGLLIVQSYVFVALSIRRLCMKGTSP